MDRKIGHYVGIGMALLVPAVVLAQAFPGPFNANAPLTAGALEGMRMEIIRLRDSVAALGTGSSPVGIGALTQPITFASGENATKTFQAPSPGILMVRGNGAGFGSAAIDVTVNSVIVARGRGGSTATAAVANGETVSVQVQGSVAPVTVGVFFRPLTGG